jgi:hypothetical protein
MDDRTREPRARSRSPLGALVLARVRLFLREPASIFWVFAFPAILAIALGSAFRDQPPEPPRVGVASDGPAALSERDRQSLTDAELTLEVAPGAVLAEKLRKGGIDVIVAPGEGADGVEYRFDPQRSEARLARLVVDEAIQRGRGRSDEAQIREVTAMPLGGRYIDFLLPGLIAMNLMGSALWGVGYGMVQERSKKLMRRFATTPLTKSGFLMSYVLSRLVFLALEVAFLVVFGALAFDVVVQGSVALVMFVSLVGVLSFTGFAVLCAARTESVEVVSGFITSPATRPRSGARRGCARAGRDASTPGRGARRRRHRVPRRRGRSAPRAARRAALRPSTSRGAGSARSNAVGS